MSFLTDLKTKMSLDDSDWKKSLESIKQIENDYVKETEKNYKGLESLRSDLDKKKIDRSKKLEEINKKIAGLEKQRQIEIEVGSNKSLKAIKKKLSLAKEIRASQEEIERINEKTITSEIDGINRTKSAQKEAMEYVKIRKKRLEESASAQNKETAELNKFKTAMAEAKTIEKLRVLENYKFNARMIDQKRRETAELNKFKTAMAEQRTLEKKVIIDQKKIYRQTYINTRATNEYEKAVEKLNYQKKIGAINQKQYDSAVRKEKIAYSEAEKEINKKTKATRSLANETIRYLRWAGTITGVVYAANRAWKATLGTGIEVSKMVESNTYGIAALTASNARMIDQYGNALTPMKKFNMAQERSAETMKLLRKEALLTPATFSQLTKVYQQAIGQTLAVTNSFGGSISEVEKNTVKLAQRFTNIAGSIGMPMERVTEEIRSSLTGNVSTDSIISTMIFGSPTEANEAVRKARKRTNGLVELYDEVLSPFDVLAKTKSYEKGFLAMQGAWENMMAGMVQKSGAFKDITNAFYDMAESLSSGKDGIVEDFDDIYEALKSVSSVVDNVAVPAAAIASVYALSAASRALTASTIALTAAAMKNPYIAAASVLSVGAYSLYEYYTDEAEKADEASKILAEKTDKINEQEVKKLKEKRKLLEYELKKQTEVYSKLRRDSSIQDKGTFFTEGESDEEHKADKKKTKDQREIVRRIKYRLKLFDSEIEKKLRINKITEKKLDIAKQETELIAKLALDKEVIELSEKAIEKNKSKTLKLEEEKRKITNDIAINEEKLANELKRQIPQQVAINELAKTINLEKKAESEISSQVAKINLDAKQKELKAELELKVAIQKNLGTEVTKKDIIEFELNALGKQLAIEDEIIERKKLQKKIQEEIYKYNSIGEKETEWGFSKDTFSQDEFTGLFDENIEKSKTKIDPITLEIKMKGFDEVSSAIAGIGNGMQDLMHINREYEKDLEKINKANLTYAEYEHKKEQATYKHITATIGGYANMTGAIASFYGEDDKRRQRQLELSKVFQAAQMAMLLAKLPLQISSAIAESGAEAGIPGVIAMVALLGSLGVMAGSSGSSGGTISAQDQAIKVQESETELILDRLDRQIELLEQLNQAGTAGVARVEYSKLNYESEVDKVSRKIAEDFTRNTGSSSGLYEDTQRVFKTKYDELLSNIGFDIFNAVEYNLNGNGTFKVRADEVYGDTEKTFDFLVYFNENRDVFNSLMTNMEDDLNSWINDAQQAIADYTTATLESLSELTDASKKFKEISDSISMSDFYKSQDLQKATEDVNKILSESGATDLSDYLNNYITEIDALNEYFTDETYSLLMSQNISDLSEQTKKVNELNELLGTTYITTAEDALNYIDSIELVGDALANSNENIKSWEDGFKSDYEIAQDLARSFNVTLATSYNELDNLFDSLKGGIEGLSDAEIELLNANKALIEESSQAINDAFLGAYSPLDQRQKADYAALVASNPEDYSISAIDASYLALQESAKVATRDEDIVTQFNDYTSLLLEQTEEDASRTDIVNGIRENGTTLNDIVDRLERIEEANVNL